MITELSLRTHLKRWHEIDELIEVQVIDKYISDTDTGYPSNLGNLEFWNSQGISESCAYSLRPSNRGKIRDGRSHLLTQGIY